MRLIDADALIEYVYDDEKHNAFMTPFKLCTADRVDLKFLLNEAPTIDAAPQWISVKERMPESGTRNLVLRYDYVTSTPFCEILWYEKGVWWNRKYCGDFAVTHWMPLPEVPKEE